MHLWKDWSLLEHFPKFRYGEGKVLGTQPHLTCESASTHYVPSLNLIKGKFNMLF